MKHVKATSLCFYGGSRRRIGAKFSVEDHEFSELNMVEIDGPAPEAVVATTVPALKAQLDAMKIAYPANAKKADLIALLGASVEDTDKGKDTDKVEGADDLT